MIKKGLMVLFLFVLVLPLALAADTEIKIKTSQFTEVHLAILDSGTPLVRFSAIYKKTSDFYGDVTFIHSGTRAFFDLKVTLKKGGQLIYSEEFRNGYTTGKPIYLEVAPPGYELLETPDALPEPSNETELEDENATVEGEDVESEGESSISGFSISNLTDAIPFKTILYVLGIMLFLGILFFSFKHVHANRAPAPRQIKVRKLSEMGSHKKEKSSDDLMGSIESKLKDLHEEINRLKKEKK